MNPPSSFFRGALEIERQRFALSPGPLNRHSVCTHRAFISATYPLDSKCEF